MLVIFKRLFRDKIQSLMLFCIMGILLIWLYFLFFPLIVEQSENIRGFMESLPIVLLKAIGVDDLNTFFNIEGFLTYKHYNATLPLLIIFLTVSLAGSSLSGEIERGTIETPLACPVSRIRMFFGVFAVGIVALLIFTICAVFSVVPAGAFGGIEYVLKFHLLIAIASCFFGWSVLSVAMLVSSLCSEARRSYMIMGGILFVMYILYLISMTIGSLSWLRYFSLFGYYDPNYILLTNKIDYSSLFVFSAVALMCTFLGAYHFNKRDICL